MTDGDRSTQILFGLGGGGPSFFCGTVSAIQPIMNTVYEQLHPSAIDKSPEEQEAQRCDLLATGTKFCLDTSVSRCGQNPWAGGAASRRLPFLWSQSPHVHRLSVFVVVPSHLCCKLEV